MTEPVTLNDAQFAQVTKIIADIGHKSSGVHWDTVVPIFFSALFGFVVGVALEYFKSHREKTKAKEKAKKAELVEVNTAVIVAGSNLEQLIHSVMQNIIPHYDDSSRAYIAGKQVPLENEAIAAFMPSLMRDYPQMMTTAPVPYFVEYQFFDKLPFFIDEAPELLQHGARLNNQARTLAKALQDRNRQIEQAYSESVKGAHFPQILQAVQIQDSIGGLECVTSLSLVNELVSLLAILESVGLKYAKVGEPKKVVPPPVLNEVVALLTAIATPLIDKMPDRQTAKPREEQP